MIELLLTSAILFFAAAIQSLTGFGLALLAVPFLLFLYDPQIVVPVVLTGGAALTVMLFIESYRRMKPGQILYLLLGGIPGLPIGVHLLTEFSAALLKVVIGLTVTCFAVLLSLGLSKRFARERLTGMGVGLISGVLAGSTSMLGPPVILFGVNQDWDKESLRANLIGYAFFLLLAAVVVSQRFGLITSSVVQICLVASAPIFLGFIVGVKLKRKVSQRLFRRLALFLALFGGLLSLTDGLDFGPF